MPTHYDLVFLLGVAFILNHELDAIRRCEWRFFFALTHWDDEHAYQLFTALHIPLFILIIHNWNGVNFQLGFDAFLTAHGLVHWVLRHHPLVDFNSWFSRLWIMGGAGFGLVHCGLVWLT